ncbi:UvrD-helicase domain-containing protein [Streptomyces sp. NBC_01383]|uniref:UvrD-helicase domain-containing protein n=1 Tax=Streptomyces sp. NBC_01383 TaxID=2903846 RepID=UPI003254C39B
MIMPDAMESPSSVQHFGAAVPAVVGMEQLRAQARAAQKSVVDLPCDPGRIVRVEACPGAGKTRTIIDRHLNRPLALRQGRAVVSFTRAASAEIARRCADAGRPALAAYPHFIGTFDNFLWTHIVRPHIASPTGQTWRRLESWDDHPKARKNGVSLSDFHFARDELGRVRIIKPQWKNVPYALRRDTARQRYFLGWATEQMQALWKEGFIAGEQLRDISLHMLGHPERGARIAAMLASRFGEIVIDESQDLSSEDQSVLSQLAARNVPLLAVGDPDQSIYGFREPSAGTVIRATAEPAADFRLRHNWRSTQIICDLARTLRPSGEPADVAVGDHRDEAIPVLLIGLERGRTHSPLEKFEEEADQLEIKDPAQRMVLAYRHESLRVAQANLKEDPPSAQLGALVWATAVLRDPGAQGKRRERAERVFSECVRHHWLGDMDVPEREHLDRHGISALEFRLATRIVLTSLPNLDLPAGEWSRAAVQIMKEHLFGKLGRFATARVLACPQDKKAKAAVLLASKGSKPGGRMDGLRSNTIHGVKGEEFDAVLVLVPPTDKSGEERQRTDTFIETWSSGRHIDPTDRAAEAMRVHYVAATRARRLLAFAVDQQHLPQLATLLRANHVPVSER